MTKQLIMGEKTQQTKNQNYKGVWKNLNMASLCVCVVGRCINTWSDSSSFPSPSLSCFCTGPIFWMNCFSVCGVICSACGLMQHLNTGLNAEWQGFFTEFSCWCCTVVFKWFANVTLILLVPLVMNKLCHAICIDRTLMHRLVS